MRLSVLSAQGLLNRDGAEVYTYVGQDAWLLDFYKERGYVKEVRDYDDPYRLLSDICGDGISGIVVYDPEKKFTINLATNMLLLNWNMSISVFPRLNNTNNIPTNSATIVSDFSAAAALIKKFS